VSIDFFQFWKNVRWSHGLCVIRVWNFGNRQLYPVHTKVSLLGFALNRKHAVRRLGCAPGRTENAPAGRGGSSGGGDRLDGLRAIEQRCPVGFVGANDVTRAAFKLTLPTKRIISQRCIGTGRRRSHSAVWQTLNECFCTYSISSSPRERWFHPPDELSPRALRLQRRNLGAVWHRPGAILFFPPPTLFSSPKPIIFGIEILFSVLLIKRLHRQLELKKVLISDVEFKYAYCPT